MFLLDKSLRPLSFEKNEISDLFFLLTGFNLRRIEAEFILKTNNRGNMKEGLINHQHSLESARRDVDADSTRSEC